MGNHLFFPAATLPAVKPLFFSNFAREKDRCQAVNMTRYQDTLSGVVLLPFGYFGEVNQLCTQFGRFDSRYMPLGVDRLRSRSGSNARPLHLGTESRLLLFGFVFFIN